MSIIHFANFPGGGTSYDLSQLATTYTDTGTATTTYGISVIFRSADATVDVTKLIGADLPNEQDPYVSPISEATGLYVRCLYVSGDTMTGGDAVDTWHLISTDRTFTMNHTTAGGNDELVGLFTFALATDSGGTNIVATAANMTINVGETA